MNKQATLKEGFKLGHPEPEGLLVRAPGGLLINPPYHE